MLKRSIRASVLTLLVALLLTGVASAHAILVRSDPADGAVLNASPGHLRLWFSEPLLLNFTSFELIDSHGRPITLTNFHLDDQDPAEIVIDLPGLKPDAYRLTWKTVSSDDLHTSTGSLVFGVQQAAEIAAGNEATPSPSPIEVLLRWLNFGALAGVVGALAVAFLLLPLALRALPAQIDDQILVLSRQSRRRLLALALCACLLAMAAGVGLLLTQVAIAGRLSLDNLQQVITQTSYGTYGLMREGWLAVLVVVMVLRWRDPAAASERDSGHSSETDRLTLAAIVPLVLALATMQSLTGHAGAFTDVSPVRIAADLLHLMAASMWAGGLLAMALALVPLLRRGPTEKLLARSILQRFGVLAACSVAVLFVTGLYSSGQEVASIDALLTTRYGQSLLLKIGLVLSVGLIGLVNSSLLHPRVADAIRRVLHRPIGWTLLDQQHVAHTVMIEAIGTVTILLFAGWLSASQPARGPEFDPPAAQPTAPAAVTTPINDLILTLSVKPDRPGQNFISIGVFDTRRPAPAPIAQVAVRLTPPDPQRGAIEMIAESQGSGRYQVTGGAFDTAGDWQIAIRVMRPRLPDVTAAVSWPVLPALQVPAARPVLVSNQPLAPWLTLAAAILALIIAGTLFGIKLQPHWRHALRRLACHRSSESFPARVAVTPSWEHPRTNGTRRLD